LRPPRQIPFSASSAARCSRTAARVQCRREAEARAETETGRSQWWTAATTSPTTASPASRPRRSSCDRARRPICIGSSCRLSTDNKPYTPCIGRRHPSTLTRPSKTRPARHPPNDSNTRLSQHRNQSPGATATPSGSTSSRPSTTRGCPPRCRACPREGEPQAATEERRPRAGGAVVGGQHGCYLSYPSLLAFTVHPHCEECRGVHATAAAQKEKGGAGLMSCHGGDRPCLACWLGCWLLICE